MLRTPDNQQQIKERVKMWKKGKRWTFGTLFFLGSALALTVRATPVAAADGQPAAGDQQVATSASDQATPGQTAVLTGPQAATTTSQDEAEAATTSAAAEPESPAEPELAAGENTATASADTTPTSSVPATAGSTAGAPASATDSQPDDSTTPPDLSSAFVDAPNSGPGNTPDNPFPGSSWPTQPGDYQWAMITVQHVDENGNHIIGYDTYVRAVVGSPQMLAGNTDPHFMIPGYSARGIKGFTVTGDETVTLVYDKIGAYRITPPAGAQLPSNMTATTFYDYNRALPQDGGKVTVSIPNDYQIPYYAGYKPVAKDNEGNVIALLPNDPTDVTRGVQTPDPVQLAKISDDISISYEKNPDQTAEIHFTDAAGDDILGTTPVPITGGTVGEPIDDASVNKVVPGWILTKDPTTDSPAGSPDNTFDADETKPQRVNLVYAKIGTVVVNSKTSAGLSQAYQNNQNDPRAAFAIIPDQPGYTPTTSQGTLTKQTKGDYLLVPADPLAKTTINYTPLTQYVHVHYVDRAMNELSGHPMVTIAGESDGLIDYGTKTLANYTLAVDGTTTATHYDTDTTHDQDVYLIYYPEKITILPKEPATQDASEATTGPKTGHTPVDPTRPNGLTYPYGVAASDLNKTATETIYFKDSADGQTDVSEAKTFTLAFTRKAIFNTATGEVTYEAWTPVTTATFAAYPAPAVPGMVPDQSTVGPVTDSDAADLKLTVYYTSKPVVGPSETGTGSSTTQPSNPDNQQPSVPDNQQPSTPDDQQPSAPDNQQPSVPDDQQPSVPDNQQPSVPDDQQPSASDNHQPSTPDNHQPSVPDNQQPSAPDNQQPSTPDNQQPSAPIEGKIGGLPAASTPRPIAAQRLGATSAGKRVLPKTGDAPALPTAAVGLSVMAAMLSLLGYKRKREDDR